MTSAVTDHLDGDTLARALVSGIHRVIGEQELLNRINVFPVADSDTGTNLSLSLSSALGVLNHADPKHLGTLLAATADALLDGARGNSGAIVAQFFQGMSDAAGELTRFTTYTFGQAIKMGADYAHDALSEPREGTILSAINAFSISFRHQVQVNPTSSFADIFVEAVLDVDAAVAETPKQLDVLRKAGVVDAGAKGFAELVGGFADFVVSGRETPMPNTTFSSEIEPAVEFSAADNTSPFRYCTECLVTAVEIDRRKLREALSTHGDSLVLAGSKRKAKIHIHVDKPDEVFHVARQYGELSGEKADDMHRQQSAAHNSNKTFAVITDSAADISDHDMERLDIHMVPCRVQFGDRGFLDKVSISPTEFYDELRNNAHHPTTSQPAPGDFRRQFQFLASHFNDVLSINLTSRASGTYEGALSAAKRCKAPGRIHVVDSLNAAMGQGQLVVLAAECATADMGIDETLRLITSEVPKVRTFALLSDLRYAVRGGRLAGWVKMFADLMHMTPIISIKTSGKVGIGGCLLGRYRRIARFAKFIAKHVNVDQPIEIGLGHACCVDDARILEQRLRDEIPSIELLKTCELGIGLGVHGGPGTLTVSFRTVTSSTHSAD